MKKGIIIVITLLLVSGMVFALAACGSNSQFYKLERAFASTNETMESLDEASAQDLSNDNINMTVSASGAYNFLPAHSIAFADGGEEEEELTNGQKVMEILDSKQSIKDKQVIVNGLKESLNTDVQELKQNIKSFKEQELSLTEEEKVMLAEYIDEIIALRSEIKGTIGKVYQEMQGLRGKYNLQNIDLVYSTAKAVEAQMVIRVEAGTRLSEIAVELNDYLEVRLSPAEEPETPPVSEEE